MIRLFYWLGLICCAFLSVVSLSQLDRASEHVVSDEAVLVVLPPEIVKLTSGEFSSVVADYLLLESMVTYAQAREGGKEISQMPEAQKVWLESTLELSTDLDPYFYDPYYFAVMNLPWDLGNFEWTVRLLEKGVSFQLDDWSLAYYAGFQEFYFLHNYQRAAELLLVAAERPGAPKASLASIAARLAYTGNKVEVGIAFLEQMLDEDLDPRQREEFEKRLSSLRIISLLNKAVAVYEKVNGVKPASIATLVEKGVVKGIPADPYGGKFYIDTDGEVKTTSNLRDAVQ